MYEATPRQSRDTIGKQRLPACLRALTLTQGRKTKLWRAPRCRCELQRRGDRASRTVGLGDQRTRLVLGGSAVFHLRWPHHSVGVVCQGFDAKGVDRISIHLIARIDHRLDIERHQLRVDSRAQMSDSICARATLTKPVGAVIRSVMALSGVLPAAAARGILGVRECAAGPLGSLHEIDTCPRNGSLLLTTPQLWIQAEGCGSYGRGRAHVLADSPAGLSNDGERLVAKKSPLVVGGCRGAILRCKFMSRD
ncbi:Uncharacterised protein [Mycolicibacterium phlei]|nr:Uncharacterised protein [Mycolicibacterium phlei]